MKADDIKVPEELLISRECIAWWDKRCQDERNRLVDAMEYDEYLTQLKQEPLYMETLAFERR